MAPFVFNTSRLCVEIDRACFQEIDSLVISTYFAYTMDLYYNEHMFLPRYPTLAVYLSSFSHLQIFQVENNLREVRSLIRYCI